MPAGNSSQLLIRCNDRRLQWTTSPKMLWSLCASQGNIQRQSDFYFLFLPLKISPAIINEPVKWEIITKNIETAGVSFNSFYFFTSKCFNRQNYAQANSNIINHKIIFFAFLFLLFFHIYFTWQKIKGMLHSSPN